ncbi:MAG: alpha/beta hydrolase [Chlamydiales bacterium]|nr:alpha/beta hydrolase [Chlamydiales bacterium]
MKPPLILVSGLLSDKRVWRHQIEHLEDIATIQVASPTQNRPERMVEEILANAPSKFALAGHSMGGWLCIEIMRTAPFRVEKLCLLNTTANDDTDEKKAKRQEMIARVKNHEFFSIAEELSDLLVENAPVKRDVLQMFLDVGEEAFINQEEAMLCRKPCEPLLSTISCPSLVIHAAKDRNFSLRDHEELAAKIPKGKLAVIDDSGHMSPMEAPQAVTTLLRYWLTYY